MDTDYTPKILKTRTQKNKIHPIATKLSELFVEALTSNPPLENTAWCIELAQHAIAWELIAAAQNKPDLFVQNKIRERIENDKGIRII